MCACQRFRCIFCVIDADNSGYLEVPRCLPITQMYFVCVLLMLIILDTWCGCQVTEISKLLSMWGMPVLEALETVRAVSRSADENHDDKISFDEFQICFRPLWKYAYVVYSRPRHRHTPTRSTTRHNSSSVRIFVTIESRSP